MSNFKFSEEEEPEVAPPEPAPSPPAPAKPAPIPSPTPPKIPSPPTPSAPTNRPIPSPPAPKSPTAQPTSPPAPARPAAPTPVRPPGAQAPKPPAAHPAPISPVSGGAPPAPVAPTPITAQPQSPAPNAATGAPTDKSGESLYNIGSIFRNMLDRLEPIAIWVLRIACLFGALGLAYMLVGVLFSKPADTNAPNFALLARNLDLSAKVFTYALIAASIAAIIMAYEDTNIGVVLVIIGLVMHFGLPMGLKQFVGDSLATAQMAGHFRSGGFILLIIGLVKAFFDLMAWLVTLPERVKARADVGVGQQAEAKQRAIARDANMFSPCWKLPFCREVIRKQCPAFLARKTCWKFGRGCYCDEEMISRIVRGESLEVIKAPTRQSQAGKPPCGRCYIFLEHQTHKFRMMSPLALPGTVGAMFLIWPIYGALFNFVFKQVDAITKSLSFSSPTSVTPDDLKVADPNAINKYSFDADQVAQFAHIIGGVLIGFFLLIYVSKFIEWAIYKAKL